MANSIAQALDELRAGKLIIVVDDEDRENEGDLIVAAEKVTPEAVNFMAKHGRGLICLALTGKRIEELGLHPMTQHNTSRQETAFHVSFGAAKGITTGISAADRARTIQVAVDPAADGTDIVQPGHVFPLKARKGGVLVRAGHTEAAVDLTTLAGLYPAGVICEIMNEDGTMARMPDLRRFAETHSLNIYTIADLIKERRRRESLIRREAETSLPTEHGPFRLVAYETDVDHQTHVALVKGDPATAEAPLVRVHSECLTGDVFHSLRCDCGAQLDESLRLIAQEECGVLVYMRQEGRGIGLVNKIRAYELQDQGMDTVEANVHLGFDPDPREYGIGAQILADLGVQSLRLITNNPVKRAGLEGYGLKVVGRVPLEIPVNEVNRRYMETKKAKLGHLLA